MGAEEETESPSASQTWIPALPHAIGPVNRTITAARFDGTSTAPAIGSISDATAAAGPGAGIDVGAPEPPDRSVAGSAQPPARANVMTTVARNMAAVVGGRVSALHGKSPPMSVMSSPPLADLVDLVLASASPRRRELLERMGLALLVLPADVDETPRAAERPADYVRRIAAAKCDVVADRIASGQAGTPGLPVGLPILAADTTVIVEDRILGKPTDADDARAMLTLLAGRRHEVTTAYRIRSGERAVDRAVTTLVAFRSLRPAELDAYLACGEWRGKAGAYAVQGIAGAFITELRGSHTNVIGLPVAEVLADLQALGALPAYPPSAFGGAA